ncbi:MAG: hypothetical protein AAGH15_16135 [Myxococcota bacterium]
MADAPNDDELVRALQRRDKTFLFRLGLRLTVVVLLGVYAYLTFDKGQISGCATRGFGTLTGGPATPAPGTAAPPSEPGTSAGGNEGR